MEPLYIEGLNAGFLRIGAYPGISFHENDIFCLHFMRYVFSVINSIMMCTLAASVVYSLAIADSFTKLVEYFYSGSSHIMIAIKVIYHISKHDQIMKCLEVLKFNCLKCMTHSVYQNQELYHGGIKECNIMSFLWRSSVYFGLSVWILNPIFKYFYEYFKSGSYVPGLYKILDNAYPISYNYSPVFELVFAWEAFVAVLMTENIIFQDLIFYAVVTMLCSQISILRSSLCCIKYSTDWSIISQQELNQQVVVCIQDHQKIVR